MPRKRRKPRPPELQLELRRAPVPKGTKNNAAILVVLKSRPEAGVISMLLDQRPEVVPTVFWWRDRRWMDGEGFPLDYYTKAPKDSVDNGETEIKVVRKAAWRIVGWCWVLK